MSRISGGVRSVKPGEKAAPGTPAGLQRAVRRGLVQSALFCLLVAVPAPADEVLSLQVLVDEALEKNPEIQRAESMWEMARQKGAQARALPDPVLQFEMQNVGATRFSVGEMDMSMAGFSVSQSLPYPGKRRLRQEVAAREAGVAGSQVEVVRLSVLSRLKVAYYELAYVEEALEVVESTRQILESFEQVARTRYSAGEGLQQDLLKVQLELSMLVERAQMLEQMREGLRAELNALLDRPPGALLGRPQAMGPVRALPPLGELERRVREQSPELAGRREAIDAGRAQVQLMQKEYAPDFMVGAGWKTRGGLEDIYQVMVAVDLPLQRQRRRAGVAEAVAARRAAEDERRASEAMLLAQVRDLAALASASGRLVALYRETVLPQTALALESATAGYQVGRVEFMMLLDSVRGLLDNELMVHQNLARHHQAIARLEGIVGGPLEEEGH